MEKISYEGCAMSRRQPAVPVIVFFVLICTAMVFRQSHAFDVPQENLVALDSTTFIVSKEFSTRIQLYLCKVRDNKIHIVDSCCLPYMTMDHRDLSETPNDQNTGKSVEPPIIKITP